MPLTPPALVTGLDHVQIEAPAGCEAAARALFGGLLGLPEVAKPLALRGRGGVWLALLDGRQVHVSVAPDFGPRVKGHAALRCADLAAVRAHLEACGVPCEADHDTGAPRVFLSDPFGHRLEIVQEAPPPGGPHRDATVCDDSLWKGEKTAR
ncbi:catechol 2,3-dioxygenase-like lactoylglutathione lyase family enzyme [Deinococcus metalli]|uniref:Catechol 2,3-dioxygenase-like lactoylglutathione lyase family enzyme n=1 Tax=Deinococcus metalli TaxID=1141878 RepID=A0A7W8NRW7_9DEIO|nr:glyoxalase [Deinococcus metalli]MBB5378305.1 catechol 2,3-dioxygenase-like lactoylglutathione lyase family enzyme [Deinococcus metalli]GHF59854.1 glyoxalase [Deinococcus metalli]